MSYYSSSTQERVRAVSKGVHGARGFVRKAGYSAHHTTSTSAEEPLPGSETASYVSDASSLPPGGKPWKKHHNRNKREKTRRLVKSADSVPYY